MMDDDDEEEEEDDDDDEEEEEEDDEHGISTTLNLTAHFPRSQCCQPSHSPVEFL